MNDPLSNAGFLESVRFACSTINGVAKNLSISDDDVVAIVSSAALQLLAARVGAAGAIEHLRSVADVAERELLANGPHRDPADRLN